MSRTVAALGLAAALLAGCGDADDSRAQIAAATLPRQRGVWTSREELARLPVSGPAWRRVLDHSRAEVGKPDVSDQTSRAGIRVLARALVHARTGDAGCREEVRTACRAVIGSEAGGRTLALGWKTAAYVVAADLVGLPDGERAAFGRWLRGLLDARLQGSTLRETHERRPNNWGAGCGATRAAIAVYLGDARELSRTAQVFKGWLGDRAAYSGFRFRDLWWQADAARPVGINPTGAMRDGRSIDGVLPDDQRRAGRFRWPPPKENYVYTALQGALVCAEILHRAGYDVYAWQDRALLRAWRWLQEQGSYPPAGDDVWLVHLINRRYATRYPARIPARPGKLLGFTDWTHSVQRNVR